jgi:Flp pilus assembly protein TadG
MPLVFVILFGIIDFGLLLYNKAVITNGSREGARAGITWSSLETVKTIAETYCNDRLIPKAATAEAVPEPGGAFQDDYTVTVTYQHQFIFSGIIGLEQTTLTARTVMKMEPLPPT